MPTIQNKIKDNPKKAESVTGFLGGGNSFQDETVIKDSELTKYKNILLSVDGIEPRPGTLYYGGSQDSRVRGLSGYYKSTGAIEMVRFSGGKLYKKNGSNWTQLGSSTWTLDSDMNMIQVRDNLYLWNGIEKVRYYDGSTVKEFTTMATPTGLTVTAKGTVGATQYSYRVSAFNGVGETLASTAVSILNGNSAIDVTNYNLLGWVPVTGATGYNVYGRKSIGLGETYLATVYETGVYQETKVDADINVDDTIKVSYDTATASPVVFRGSGTMPTGITAGTTYYAIRQSATSIKLSDTAAHATAGTNIVDITAVGSGVRILEWPNLRGYADTATTADGSFLDPSSVILPPEGNTTTGIISKKAIFSQSRIFAAGDSSNPSRLYYGGVGSNINNFSFSETGGGATDIFKNDGAVIRDILPFQGGVIIWKDNAIYKFYFNSLGQPTLEEITRSFGGISWRGAKHVENDIIFPARKDGRLAFYSLGNQENYSAGILRTNELSIKIAKDLENVNVARLQYAAAFYFNNIYGCIISKSGSTTNDRTWCLDTRFGAWTYWEGISANCFSEYTDSTGQQKMYFGSDTTGYVNEMFTTDRNDNGVAISVNWATKAFNQKAFSYTKKYFNPILQFKDISSAGAINGDVILDGAIVTGAFSVNQATSGGAGVGASFFGVTLPGEAPAGTPPVTMSADTIVELNMIKKSRSIKFEFRSNTLNARYKFLSVAFMYKILEGKRLPSSSRTYVG